jgi:GTP-binding protein SAR1
MCYIIKPQQLPVLTLVHLFTMSEEGQGWFGWMWGWVRSVLTNLGLANVQAKMLFLGLDNAGKTTLLGTLCSGRVRSCKPTIRPNCEELVLGNVVFTTYDLGGHTSARSLWDEYLVDVGVIVFMVDATDTGRLDESRGELNKLLGVRGLKDVPIVVLGNKIDLPEALSEREFRDRLGLPAHATTGTGTARKTGSRPIEVFMCSVVNRSGYSKAFKWVSNYL